MYAKKAHGKVFGVTLTAAEKKAMDMEIRRQLVEFDKAHLKEIDAMILWILRSEFGFGEVRLKRFYDNFKECEDDFWSKCEDEKTDIIWLYENLLKGSGVDVDKVGLRR